jgi:transposase
MVQQSIRKTYRYKLHPTPQHERVLERVLMLCRHVYNAALQERREAWQKCGVNVTYYQQKAELPGVKEAMPGYGEVHSQVLQDVVLRVERAFQAFFQRIGEGQAPGYPASMAETATIASPTRSSRMARGWTMDFSFSPRLAELLCGGVAR